MTNLSILVLIASCKWFRVRRSRGSVNDWLSYMRQTSRRARTTQDPGEAPKAPTTFVVNCCGCLTRVWFRRQLLKTTSRLIVTSFSHIHDGLLRRYYASHDETHLFVNTRSHFVTGAVSSAAGSGIVAVPSETSQLDVRSRPLDHQKLVQSQWQLTP